MKKIANILSIFAICAHIVLLQGCTDGKDNKESGPSNNGPETTGRVVVNSTVVKLAPEVNPALVAAIKQIVSPLERGKIGSNIPHSYSQESEHSVIFAVDTENNILLAGLASGPTTTLDVESTAVTLTRIIFGQPFDGTNDLHLESDIKASASFPALVKAIMQAHDAGISPVQSSEVLNSISLVLKDTASASVNRIDLQAKNSTRAAHQPSIPPVPPAYNLIPDVGGLPSIYVTGGGAAVVNSMPIAWTAVGSTAPNKEVPLPASSLLTALAGKVDPLLGANPVIVPDDNGSGFDLTVKQTLATRRETLTSIMAGIYSTLFDFMIPRKLVNSECSAKIGQVLLSPEKLGELAGAASAKAFADYLQSFALNGTALFEAITTCSPELKFDIEKRIESMEFFGNIVTKLFGAYAAINKLNDAATLGAKVSYITTFWSRSETVGVCQAKGTLADFFAPKIVSCAASLKFDPALLLMAEGAEFTSVVSAYDADNKQTLLPAKLDYLSSSPSATIDTQTGKITAGIPGSATITVRDAYTGASGTLAVEVVEPVPSPNPLKILVGNQGTINLVDSKGRQVLTSPAIKFSMPDLSKVTIDPNSLFPNAGLTVTGKAIGATSSTFTNVVTGKESLVDILVGTGLTDVCQYVASRNGNTTREQIFLLSEFDTLSRDLSGSNELLRCFKDSSRSLRTFDESIGIEVNLPSGVRSRYAIERKTYGSNNREATVATNFYQDNFLYSAERINYISYDASGPKVYSSGRWNYRADQYTIILHLDPPRKDYTFCTNEQGGLREIQQNGITVESYSIEKGKCPAFQVIDAINLFQPRSLYLFSKNSAVQGAQR